MVCSSLSKRGGLSAEPARLRSPAHMEPGKVPRSHCRPSVRPREVAKKKSAEPAAKAAKAKAARRVARRKRESRRKAPAEEARAPKRERRRSAAPSREGRRPRRREPSRRQRGGQEAVAPATAAAATPDLRPERAGAARGRKVCPKKVGALLGVGQQTLGIKTFRPGQAEAFDHLLGGEDLLAVMPTGSGKSLLYQLTSMVVPGRDRRGQPADRADQGSARQDGRQGRRRGEHRLDADREAAPRGRRARFARPAASCCSPRPSAWPIPSSACSCARPAAASACRGSSSTKRTASRSGATTSGPRTCRCARRSRTSAARRCSRRPRPRRRTSATTSCSSSGWRRRRSSRRRSIVRTSTSR